MSVLNMAKNIKEIHPDYILCFKVGSFYHCFGKDSYIMSYLFGYQIKSGMDNNMCSIGYPKNALPKVQARLEKEKINYLLIDTRNNYDVDEKSDYKNLNTYLENYEKAQKYVKLKRKINKISENLTLKIFDNDIKDKLKKIEEIINNES